MTLFHPFSGISIMRQLGVKFSINRRRWRRRRKRRRKKRKRKEEQRKEEKSRRRGGKKRGEEGAAVAEWADNTQATVPPVTCWPVHGDGGHIVVDDLAALGGQVEGAVGIVVEWFLRRHIGDHDRVTAATYRILSNASDAKYRHPVQHDSHTYTILSNMLGTLVKNPVQHVNHTYRILSNLSITLIEFCPTWQSYLWNSVKHDSHTHGILSNLTVTLTESCPTWQSHLWNPVQHDKSHSCKSVQHHKSQLRNSVQHDNHDYGILSNMTVTNMESCPTLQPQPHLTSHRICPRWYYDSYEENLVQHDSHIYSILSNMTALLLESCPTWQPHLWNPVQHYHHNHTSRVCPKWHFDSYEENLVQHDSHIYRILSNMIAI